jgi:hypothetical protein
MAKHKPIASKKEPPANKINGVLYKKATARLLAGCRSTTQLLAVHSAAVLAALAGLVLAALMLLAGFVLTALLLLAGLVLTALLRVLLLLLRFTLWILLFVGHFEALQSGGNPAQCANTKGCVPVSSASTYSSATIWNHRKNTNGENPERDVVAPQCPC